MPPKVSNFLGGISHTAAVFVFGFMSFPARCGDIKYSFAFYNALVEAASMSRVTWYTASVRT